MKEVYYVYNNEAISSCVLLSVIDKLGKIDISRCCLVLPFLLDDRTTTYVMKNFDDEMSLSHLVNTQPRLFASFNKRYLSLMPVMINALMILKKGNQIGIQVGNNDQIVSNNSLDLANLNLGERFSRINGVIPAFLKLLENYSTEQLYKIFRVQL